MSDTTMIDKSASAVSSIIENSELGDDGWDEVKDVLEYPDVHDVDGLGQVRGVESFGGEGQGDEYYLVFSVTFDDGDVKLYRINGYYTSHDGGYLDGDLYEVQAKQRLVTFYE